MKNERSILVIAGDFVVHILALLLLLALEITWIVQLAWRLWNFVAIKLRTQKVVPARRSAASE